VTFRRQRQRSDCAAGATTNDNDLGLI